jgi:hypothetical protein
MLIGFTHMDKAGTRLMRTLGIPTYFCAIVLASLSPISHTPTAWLLAIAACFLYEFGYCKAIEIYYQKCGQPYMFKWAVSVVITQLVSIGLMLLSYQFYIVSRAGS